MQTKSLLAEDFEEKSSIYFLKAAVNHWPSKCDKTFGVSKYIFNSLCFRTNKHVCNLIATPFFIWCTEIYPVDK